MNQEMIVHSMSTSRLIMINATPAILKGILRVENSIQDMLDVQVPDHWTEFGHEPFEYVLEKITATPEEAIWWSWLPILVSENTLIGNCGYKGPPANGVVEIGYEIARDYRGRGFASEMAKTLVAHAFTQPEVNTIVAHTLPAENDSVRVLRKCGFDFVSRVNDPDDGWIWRWHLHKVQLLH